MHFIPFLFSKKILFLGSDCKNIGLLNACLCSLANFDVRAGSDPRKIYEFAVRAHSILGNLCSRSLDARKFDVCEFTIYTRDQKFKQSQIMVS